MLITFTFILLTPVIDRKKHQGANWTKVFSHQRQRSGCKK